MTRYGMVIDAAGCIGCNACSMACKIENNLPDDVWWTQVHTIGGAHRDTPAGTYPNLTMEVRTIGCQHCANPACVRSCPTGATYKDTETGIVLQNPDVCIGCRSCMMACPYNVRTYLADEPEYVVGHAVGDVDAFKHQARTVEKCIFCKHRVDRGELPACVDSCPSRVRTFGDLDDPESDVSKLLAERDYEQLHTEKGTQPSVYFLV